MFRFVLARLASAALVVLGVATLVFFLVHIIPGDPIEVMLGESAQVADREALRRALGLDLPIAQQWWNYMSNLAQGDLGISLYTKQSVAELLAERIPATVQLAVAGLVVAVVIAFPLGTLAALRRGSMWDRSAMGFSLLGMSIPHFWLGPLLILLFSVWLGWLPVSGREGLASLVLPAITLGTALAAILSRMLRATVLEVLGEDYIRTARAKGVREQVVIWHHAVRNALLPIVTLLGLQLGALLGGAVITETVFSWPGLGQLTIESIQRRDYPTLQACVLLISVTYVAVNTLTDMVYGWLDPRVRYGASA